MSSSTRGRKEAAGGSLLETGGMARYNVWIQTKGSSNGGVGFSCLLRVCLKARRCGVSPSFLSKLS